MLPVDRDAHTIDASGMDQVNALVTLCERALGGRSAADCAIDIDHVPSGSAIRDSYYRTLTVDQPGMATISLRHLKRGFKEDLLRAAQELKEMYVVLVLQDNLGIKSTKDAVGKGGVSGDLEPRGLTEHPTDPALVLLWKDVCRCGEDMFIYSHKADMREEDVTVECGCGNVFNVHLSPSGPSTPSDVDG